MNKSEAAAPGADWTKLLTDPQIASHLGELLRAYREAPPEKRDRALLEAMRKIKGEAAKAAAADSASPCSLTPIRSSKSWLPTPLPVRPSSLTSLRRRGERIAGAIRA